MPLRILIIEDDDLVRELLVRYFSGLGCSVCQASTVDGAITTLANFSPQVILSDVLLAEGTGLDLYNQVDTAMQARFVFMTGYAGLARVPLQATGRPVVYKPFRLQALWALLQQVAAE